MKGRRNTLNANPTFYPIRFINQNLVVPITTKWNPNVTFFFLSNLCLVLVICNILIYLYETNDIFFLLTRYPKRLRNIMDSLLYEQNNIFTFRIEVKVRVPSNSSDGT